MPAFDHIFTILMENHNYDEIIGSSQAPYANQLAAHYGLATNYFAVSHPSLPNYLALVGGSTFGISSDCTGCFQNQPNIAVDRVEASGRSWKAYAEALPSPGFVGDSYPYMQKHNPLIYFDDVRNNPAEAAKVVNYSTLSTDLASASTTPNYVWITPDMCHDTHDCSIGTGDQWLSQNIPMILSSPAYTQQNSVIFVTWDEDDNGGNQVATLVIAKSVPAGFRSSVNDTHYSLLRTVEAAWGLAPLTSNDGGASPMSDFFGGTGAPPPPPLPAPAPTPPPPPVPSPSPTSPPAPRPSPPSPSPAPTISPSAPAPTPPPAPGPSPSATSTPPTLVPPQPGGPPGSVPPPVPAPNPTPGGVTTTFVQDTFTGRTAAGTWGVASDGNLWSVQSGSPAVLSVQAGRGLVNGTDAMAPLITTLGSVTATDTDVLARYRAGDYAHDQGSLVAGYSGPGTWYAGGFDAAGAAPELSIQRSSNGTVTRVTGAPFPAVNGTAYWERLRVQRMPAGDVVSVRAWPDGSAEPGTWALTFTDPTPLPAGLAGVAALDVGRGWSIDSFWAGLPPVVPASVPPPTPFAEDTFATRTVTDGWGTASDGNPWNQQSGWTQRLSVGNGEGHVGGARDMSTMRTVLGAVTATDATLVARYTSQDYGNDDGHLLFRYSGPASYYLAGIDSPMGSPELNIMRMSNGVQARVADVAFPAVNGTSYWEMASVQTSGGSAVIRVKAWADGTPEPATWGLMYTDAAPLPGGTAGMEGWDSGKGWAVDGFAATPLVPSSPTPAGTPAPVPSSTGTPTPPPPSPAPISAPPAPPAPAPPPSPSPSPVGTDPSGVAMPTGTIPGWTPVFADDFTGSSLNAAAWGTYNGQPGGDPGGCWDPSHVVVSGGMLNLETFQDGAAQTRQGCSSAWVSGGVSSARAFSQTYGKYLVRMRAGVGHGVSAIALLWPSVSGAWPPEIDFYEDGNGARTDMSATLHCGSNGNDSCQVQKSITADFSQWHTLGVEWSPGVLNYTIDGQAWATVTNADGAVPTIPMEFDLQAQAGTCGVAWAPCPDSTTPSMVGYQIDWVAAYKVA